MKKYFVAVAGLIASATLMFAAAPAMAHANVDVNIDIPGPFIQSAPVYAAPVYAPQPVYVQPRPVYVQPRPVYYERYERQRDWHEQHWRGRRDMDHDGVPNYRDRDRDGDGVPNRWDRHPNNPYRY